jgi:hypothetical protein
MPALINKKVATGISKAMPKAKIKKKNTKKQYLKKKKFYKKFQI